MTEPHGVCTGKGPAARCPDDAGDAPGRIDMRRLGVVAIAALLGAALTVPVSAASSAFNGSWSSIDPVDGSAQHLSIRGSSGRVQMSYVDEFATTCVDVGAPTVVF